MLSAAEFIRTQLTRMHAYFFERTGLAIYREKRERTSDRSL